MGPGVLLRHSDTRSIRICAPHWKWLISVDLATCILVYKSSRISPSSLHTLVCAALFHIHIRLLPSLSRSFLFLYVNSRPSAPVHLVTCSPVCGLFSLKMHRAPDRINLTCLKRLAFPRSTSKFLIATKRHIFSMWITFIKAIRTWTEPKSCTMLQWKNISL